MRLIAPVIAVALPAFVTVAARATTIVSMDFAELCAEADVVVVAVVESVEAHRTETGDFIYTFTRFKVLQWIDGEESLSWTERDSITVKTLGGTADGETMRVHGMPRFERGREYLLFLKLDGPSLCPVVGWTQGCFRVERDDAGEAEVRTYGGSPVVAIDADRLRTVTPDDSKAPKTDSLTLSEFAAEIQAHRIRPAEGRARDHGK